MVGVHVAEGDVPDFGPLHVTAVDAVVAEVGVDALAVGAGRAAGPAVLVLDAFRRAFGDERFPELLAGGAIEAQDRAALALVVGGGQEDAVLPDDGGGVAGAADRDLPKDVVRFGPFIRISALG